MSALPAPLRPWAALLSLFPEDLALSLGEHVARLAAALGPMRARAEALGGEPQGYDGLDRRGSPERLLMSEWVMALEAPDEFIRRAAFGEQSFLRPAFSQPQGGRRTVVLLDAGPEQVGAPRIAHLALLVVLARRAQSAGARFVWGVLQSSPEAEPWSEVNSGRVGEWLSAHSARPVSPERLAEWREALVWQGAAEDVWLVGGARLGRLAAREGLSHVRVDEVYAPGVRRLAVEVRPASQAARSLVLELPPEPQCVRLLRDPFAAAVVAPVLAPSLPCAMRFSADGMRLLLKYANGSVGAQVLPNSPRDTVPRSKRVQPPPDEQVVAVGWRRQGGLLMVTRRGRELRVHGVPRGRRLSRGVWTLSLPEGPLPFQLPQPGEPPLLALSSVSHGLESPLVLDAAGTLWSISEDANAPVLRAEPQWRKVYAIAEFQGRHFFVSGHSDDNFPEVVPAPDPQRFLWAGWLNGDKSALQVLGPQQDSAIEAYIGQSREIRVAKIVPPIAVRVGTGPWRLMPSPHSHAFTLSFDSLRVGGVTGWPMAAEPRLVTLGMDERTFYRLDELGLTEHLVTASSRVVAWAVSPGQPYLAWLTDTGEVGAWSFMHRALLFRSNLGGES